MQKNKKALPIIAITLLALFVCQGATLNLADANPHYQPPIDPGYYYINVDGSVSPSTAPIERQGNVYTLTGNITGHPIWIQKYGAVLDGAGYTLQNNRTGYEVGVMLNCTASVTVKHLRVEGFNSGITAQRQIFDISPYWYEPTIPENPYPKSASNTIIDCILQNNGVGISFEDSAKNQILNNTIRGNNIGIKISRAYSEKNSANIIKNNLLEANSEGILLETKSNTITNNKIVKNSLCGLEIFWSSDNIVQNNLITRNEMGICIYGASGGDNAERNIITANQVLQNNQWGIRLNGSQTGNRIFGNNFVDNNLGKGLQVSIPMYMAIDGKVYIGRANVWNNESAGNYWSDYQTRYPNATETADGWDNPFYINENNIDQHPLTGPLTLETPMLEQEQVNSNTPTTPPYTAAAAILAVCVIAVTCLLIYRRRNKKLN